MGSFPEETLKTDVLVVGAGLAGCWAALRAADFTPRVILADKGVVSRSGTTVFCHDILAPLVEGEMDAWRKEMVEHAEYLSDQRFLEVLINEEGERISELCDWGVPFEKEKDGRLFLSLGRGHKQSRVVLVDCRKLMEVMKQQLKNKGVKLLERIMITDLLTSDGQHPTQGKVAGAVGLHTQSGKFVAIAAKAVVLATGVISLKLHGSFADNVTGDAQAMAFRAGAQLGDLEFGFSQKFAWINDGALRITSLMPYQTQGARIVNSKGERFMERYVPERGERRSGLGLLAQAAVKEIWEGRGPIYFDLRHFSPEHLQQMKRILPLRYAPFEEAGLDPSKDLIETRLVVMYFSRGILVDLDSESNIPGLMAAGICAHFPGGPELLSGTMLGICNVFGYRAGQRAGVIAEQWPDEEVQPVQVSLLKKKLYAPLERSPGITPRQLYNQIGSMTSQPQYSVAKDKASIQEMLKRAMKLRQEELPRLAAKDVHELVKAEEVNNLVDLLEPIYLACLERKESRLSHYRSDYPYQDDLEWLKWVLVKKEDGHITVSHRPVPVENNPVKPRRRERVPCPIKFGPGG